MRPTRKFLPFAPTTLEHRVVLSSANLLTLTPPTVSIPSNVILVPGAPTPGPNNSNTFPLSIKKTIEAGLPVYEQRVTKFNDGSTQTTDRLIVPDLKNHTITTTDYTSLPKGAGVEKVVDVATTVGDTTIHNVTATLPNKTTETELFAETKVGRHRSIIGGVDHLPSGGIQIIEGKSLQMGKTVITVKMVTAPNGTSQRVYSVVRTRGEVSETDTTKVSTTNGPTQVTKSTTTIVRLQPPVS